MKKILFIILALFAISGAYSQDFLINSFTGGCQFIKVARLDTAYYSDNSQVLAYIRGNGDVYLYTKVGNQIGSAYNISEISLNDSVYLTRESFITALENIPLFSSVAVSDNSVSGGQVAGDSLYLYKPNDTIVIDVSSLAGGGGTAFTDTITQGGSLALTQEISVLPYATSDFLFGSPSKDDDGDVTHDNRMFFDHVAEDFLTIKCFMLLRILSSSLFLTYSAVNRAVEIFAAIGCEVCKNK